MKIFNYFLFLYGLNFAMNVQSSSATSPTIDQDLLGKSISQEFIATQLTSHIQIICDTIQPAIDKMAQAHIDQATRALDVSGGFGDTPCSKILNADIEKLHHELSLKLSETIDTLQTPEAASKSNDRVSSTWDLFVARNPNTGVTNAHVPLEIREIILSYISIYCNSKHAPIFGPYVIFDFFNQEQLVYTSPRIFQWIPRIYYDNYYFDAYSHNSQNINLSKFQYKETLEKSTTDIIQDTLVHEKRKKEQPLLILENNQKQSLGVIYPENSAGIDFVMDAEGSFSSVRNFKISNSFPTTASNHLAHVNYSQYVQEQHTEWTKAMIVLNFGVFMNHIYPTITHWTWAHKKHELETLKKKFDDQNQHSGRSTLTHQQAMKLIELRNKFDCQEQAIQINFSDDVIKIMDKIYAGKIPELLNKFQAHGTYYPEMAVLSRMLNLYSSHTDIDKNIPPINFYNKLKDSMKLNNSIIKGLLQSDDLKKAVKDFVSKQVLRATTITSFGDFLRLIHLASKK